jgi:hypothetical protein
VHPTKIHSVPNVFLLRNAVDVSLNKQEKLEKVEETAHVGEAW